MTGYFAETFYIIVTENKTIYLGTKNHVIVIEKPLFFCIWPVEIRK